MKMNYAAGENASHSHEPDLFELSGEKLRDQGIKQVTSNNENWMDKALDAASSFVLFSRGHVSDLTGEDIRFNLRSVIGEPKHPNAWGALINTLVKRKIIAPTGEYRQPKDKSSHARAIQVYRVL